MMPEEVESIVLLWLVRVPPPLTLYCRLVPRCNVPPDKPVAARKLPVTSCREMPTSPVVLLVSWNSVVDGVVSGRDARGGIVDPLQDVVDGVGGGIEINLPRR